MGRRSARTEKADGEGRRPEGTDSGFERRVGVRWEVGFEERGFRQADGLEMDRPREREKGSHYKKFEENLGKGGATKTGGWVIHG